MGKTLEAGQVQEAAATLHSVEKAEKCVETRAVGRVGFPRDDLAGQDLQRFQRLCNELRENLVHIATCW